MKAWTEILPLIFIRWFAKKHCQTLMIDGATYVNPRPNVLIRIK